MKNLPVLLFAFSTSIFGSMVAGMGTLRGSSMPATFPGIDGTGPMLEAYLTNCQ